MTLAWILTQFVLCTGVILYAGVRLSRYGDIIAEKTGLGGAWIGVALLATVTSLPELITGASSVLLFDVPDIAAGDAIGSCMFNLLILAFLDVRNPTPLSARIHQGHVLSASFGILQLGLVALAMLAGPHAIVAGWVGVHSLAFVAVYLFAMRTIFAFERRRMRDVAEEMTGAIRYGEITLRRTAVLFTLSTAALVAAATYLPGIAARFAAVAGLSESFVGSLLVAVSTSLPEIAVSIAAARIGALDLAAGNLFGSNVFNVAVIGVDDLLYTRGSLLGAVASGHLVSLTAAILMTAVAIIGLTYRAGQKRYRLSWESLAIVIVYVAAVTLLYRGS